MVHPLRVAALMNEREYKGGDRREKREGAYSDGGVLRRRKQCLAILAELAVKHCPSVSQQRGQDPPSGHLQDLEGKDRRQERLKY